MQKIINFITSLIDEAQPLLDLKAAISKGGPTTEWEKNKDEFVRRLLRWFQNCRTVLSYSELNDFNNQVKTKLGYSPNSVDRGDIAYIAGILESARDCLTEGFVGKLKYLLHAEVFDTLLEQGNALLDSGHKIPAAVLGRIVIENWLRDQAEKAGIANWDSEKASILNDNLKKNGQFSVPKWRQIQSYLDIGNSAAHGKDQDFSENDVKLVLGFAKANCT